MQQLHENYNVTGIVIWQQTNPKGPLKVRLQRYLHPGSLIRYLVARIDIACEKQTTNAVISELFHEIDFPYSFPSAIDCLVVEDINDIEAVEFVTRHAPNIVCVNGTNLLREPMLALVSSIPLGIINLHTGLSPYTRGGNCNLFALLENHPEWVGVTVHHIDRGIDSGDLILTAQVPMEPEDNYDIIDAKTFYLGVDLMVSAVRQLAQGRATRVPQWQKGKLYLRRTGYIYEPFQRYRVNRMLSRGLVKDYLARKSEQDSQVRLVGKIV